MHDVPSTPGVLFRYRSAALLGRTLEEVQGSLWLSIGQHLNDPFDGANVPLGEEKLTSIRWDDIPGRDEPLDLEIETKEALVAACFFPDGDNVQMWSQYANGFEGIVLGYDSDRLREAVKQDKARSKLDRDLSLCGVEYTKSLAGVGDGIEGLFYKSTHWEHEKEWRLAGSVELSKSDGYSGVSLDASSALCTILIGAKIDRGSLRAIVWSVTLLAYRTGKQPELKSVHFDREANKLLTYEIYRTEIADMVGALELGATALREQSHNTQFDYYV